MFETKKSLRRQIANLKMQIGELEYSISLADNSGLSKCKGTLCKGCAHAVWVNNQYSLPVVIGCDVEKVCKDFLRLPSTNGDFHRQNGTDQTCDRY